MTLSPEGRGFRHVSRPGKWEVGSEPVITPAESFRRQRRLTTVRMVGACLRLPIAFGLKKTQRRTFRVRVALPGLDTNSGWRQIACTFKEASDLHTGHY